MVWKLVSSVVLCVVWFVVQKFVIAASFVITKPVVLSQLQDSDAGFIAMQLSKGGQEFWTLIWLVAYFILLALIWNKELREFFKSSKGDES